MKIVSVITARGGSKGIPLGFAQMINGLHKFLINGEQMF